MNKRVYTRKGDQGFTSLQKQGQIAKDHPLIEAIGAVDELNAHLGWLRDQVNQLAVVPAVIITSLTHIQQNLFQIGASLSSNHHIGTYQKPFKLKQEQITALESSIDDMQLSLHPLEQFILPGGHSIVSIGHIVRCVCRRTERSIVRLDQQEQVEDKLIIPYLNRLSDWLFTLCRYLNNCLKIPEIKWEYN